jgi:branched-chain amino acid transport system permease protein
MPGVHLGVTDAWWRGLEAAGLSHSRWRSLPQPLRRAIVLGVLGLLALVILAPINGFDVAAYLAFAVLVALLVPQWNKVPVIGKLVVPLGVLGIFVAYPYYGTRMFTMPILGAFPNMNTMIDIAVFAMMAIGLNMVVGYAGLLDLGYVAFYAIGAYSAAWFASPQFSGVFVKFGNVVGAVGPGVRGIHISIWLLLIVAAVFTGLAGVIIGLPTLRLRGDYLAIVTLGFGEILPQVARNGQNLFGFNVTNGPQGINPVDPPGFGKWLHNNIHVGGWHPLPANFNFASNGGLNVYFWTGIVLVLITLFCSIRLRDSRLGRAWIAIREDEVAAAAMGVPLMRTKTWAYASGAFFGGIAGAYYAAFKGGVFPDDFYFNISVFILCMVILGGMGNVWGVILGATILTYLNFEGLGNIGGWLNQHLPAGPHHIDLPLYSFGIYGIIIVVIMLFRPEGLLPSARRRAEFQRGVHDEPLYDVEAA